MSENFPDSLPTSRDARSRRPTKKRALTPVSAQASTLTALFAHPEREVQIPLSATKAAVAKTLGPPPEIVANVQGSSAGAGSGEFHVYKASRRREYERLRLMDEEVRREAEAREFERRTEELRLRDEAKTSKNKARRERLKARKRGEGRREGAGAGTGAGADVGGPMVGVERVEGLAEEGGTVVEGQEAVVADVGVIIHDDDD
ncbi:MAG: hypothetical protein M1829_000131 [Trizodia sp. TS-e1964]|nr:MAG: hypothetical protein M1829_000131 [Trizodia sp. TS-e1964]